MFVQGKGYIAVGTVRNVKVPVTIRTSSAEPAFEPSQWDKVVLAGLKVTSGRVRVSGVTDNGVTGGVIDLESGDYNVRALYGGLETLSADGLHGDDQYLIELWPVAQGRSAPTEPIYLK